MEQLIYLLDSNAVIDYLNDKLPASGMNLLDTIVDKICLVSIITKIEILGFTSPPDDEALLRAFIDASVVIELNKDIVERTIEIRKNFKIKIPDAIIAASALCQNLTLVTRNTSDFSRIPSLKLLNPHLV